MFVATRYGPIERIERLIALSHLPLQYVLVPDAKSLVADKQLKRVLAAAVSGTYRFHYASCLQDRSRGPLYWIQDCRVRRTSSVVVDGSREGTELNTEGCNSLRAGVPVWCKDKTYASLSQCIRERDEALLYWQQVRTVPSSVSALSP